MLKNSFSSVVFSCFYANFERRYLDYTFGIDATHLADDVGISKVEVKTLICLPGVNLTVCHNSVLLKIQDERVAVTCREDCSAK